MATADEYAAWIVKNADKRGTPDFETVAAAYRAAKQTKQAPEAAPDPTEGMSTFDKVAAGAGKAVYDMGRGVGQMVGLVNRKDVEDARRLDAALMKTTAGQVGNVVGNVAMLAPAAMIPGANTIAGGAAIGGITGLMQPSASTGETLANVGIGGAAGAFVPLAQRAWTVGKSLSEPLYEAGQNAIVGRALNKAAGKDAPAVAARLAKAATPFVGPSKGIQRTTMGELVPGSMPTVGQASGNAGVASLERAATATNPDVTNAISDLYKSQNSARVGLLSDMAGVDGERAFTAAARDATADQLYGAARRIGVDPAKLTPDALQSIATFSQRIPESVLNKARELAKISGTPMTDATSVDGMHWVKMAIDDGISSAKAAGNGTLARAYTGLQDDLLTGLDNLSPAYAVARKTYADMSRPLNQMDVAGAIADKSINKLTGNLQPNSYANALTDKTAASVTGMKGATLAGTMEPAQLNALESLLLDVQRSAAATNAAGGPGSDTVKKLAYTNLLDQAGMPSFLREFKPAQVAGNLLGRGGDAIYARTNREIGTRLAEVMLDPGQAAELMKRATPKQQNAIMQLVSRGASGLAIAAPASANALQQ
jgi:hypothetical protein